MYNVNIFFISLQPLNFKIKNMKIAIPTKDKRVDDHFGHCEKYIIYTVDNQNNVVAQEELKSPEGCGCKSDIATTLQSMGVKLMLAGNMGEGAKNVLEAKEINVIRGCSGNTDDVIKDYLAGNIKDSGEGCKVHGEDHLCSQEVISTPIHLTKEAFLTNVLNYENNAQEWNYLGDKPAIIDFYATWCGPCKAVSPVLEELAKEFAGKIYIYKIDIDQEQELAAVFGIQSVPTFLFIPMKGNPQMAMGALPKENFLDVIKNIMK